MKKIFCLALSLFSIVVAFSQTITNYDQIKLDKADDYKMADTFALQAANFLLLNPIDNAENDRLKSSQFLLKWMTGTPDYRFTFGESTKILNDDIDLMGVYLASTVKFCLDNKSLSKDQDKIKIGTWKILLSYCDDPKNNVKLTKKLKKLIEANKNKNGELEKNI